jgi:hypothetical protein
MAVAITPTSQDVWPVRVALAVTGLTAGNQVTVYRVANGVRAAVRGADHVTVSGTTLAVTDAELPFGLPVTWTVTVNGSDVVSTTPTTYDLVGGLVALTDAITGLAAEVVIGAWPTKRRERRASSFALTDTSGSAYTVVVSGAAGLFTGQLELATTSDSAASALETLLEQATGAVVQLRVPDASTYRRFDCYIAVLAWEEVLWSQDGNDIKRRWVLDVTQVRGWASSLEATAWTYDDLADAYTGSTYATLAGDFASYVDLAVADIGAI